MHRMHQQVQRKRDSSFPRHFLMILSLSQSYKVGVNPRTKLSWRRTTIWTAIVGGAISRMGWYFFLTYFFYGKYWGKCDFGPNSFTWLSQINQLFSSGWPSIYLYSGSKSIRTGDILCGNQATVQFEFQYIEQQKEFSFTIIEG